MKPPSSPGNTMHPLQMQSVGGSTRETELNDGETSWPSTLRWDLQKQVRGGERGCFSTSIFLHCRVLLKLFDVDGCISDEQVYNGVSDLITNLIITLQQHRYRTSFLSTRSKTCKWPVFPCIEKWWWNVLLRMKCLRYFKMILTLGGFEFTWRGLVTPTFIAK